MLKCNTMHEFAIAITETSLIHWYITVTMVQKQIEKTKPWSIRRGILVEEIKLFQFQSPQPQ